MNVVPLPVPNLNNIPAMLRRLADDIECDPEGVNTLVWVKYGDDGEPVVGAFGDNPSRAEVVGVLTMAAQLFRPEAIA